MTPSMTPRARFMALADEVAEAHGVRADDVMGKRRSAPVAAARQQLYLQAQERFGWSNVRIGKLVGRDHSTVVYGIQQARARMERAAA